MSLVLFLIYPVAVRLLLGCFWNNWEAFSPLCIFQIVQRLPCSCHYEDSPDELCNSIWLKTEKSKDLDLSSILARKHTTSYTLFFSPGIVCKGWFKYQCESSYHSVASRIHDLLSCGIEIVLKKILASKGLKNASPYHISMGCLLNPSYKTWWILTRSLLHMWLSLNVFHLNS